MSNKIFKIPKDNNFLKKDIKKRKQEYMTHIYECFKEIGDDNLPEKINIFSFSDTNLEIIVKKHSYEINLKNLLDYFSSIEEYEICNVIKHKLKSLKKNNINEDL